MSGAVTNRTCRYISEEAGNWVEPVAADRIKGASRESAGHSLTANPRTPPPSEWEGIGEKVGDRRSCCGASVPPRGGLRMSSLRRAHTYDPLTAARLIRIFSSGGCRERELLVRVNAGDSAIVVIFMVVSWPLR